MGKEIRLADILPTGAENALLARDISKIYGLGIRQIDLMAQTERRKDGAPICSGNEGIDRGYFLAADQEELQRTIDRQERRGKECYDTAAALKKILPELPERG